MPWVPTLGEKVLVEPSAEGQAGSLATSRAGGRGGVGC